MILAAAATDEVSQPGMWASVQDLFADPQNRLYLACALAAVSLWFALPRRGRKRRGPVIGGVLGVAAVVLFATLVSPLATLGEQVLFWTLAGLTLFAAGATVSVRSPVYCAIYFALTVLGTAALFFAQGSQFLAVATVVVYAGAIVVTFLFVVMLAQPEGHTTYDRVSWGWMPTVLGCAAAAGLAGVVIHAVMNLQAPLRQQVLQAMAKVNGADDKPLVTDEDVRSVTAKRIRVASRPWPWVVRVSLRSQSGRLTLIDQTRLEQAIAQSPLGKKVQESGARLRVDFDYQDTLSRAHVASLGGRLFSEHLIAVELGGALLLAALVGAVAIVIQGRRRRLAASPEDEGAAA